MTRKGGGTAEWIWKGAPDEPASIEWLVSYPKNPLPIRHSVAFRAGAHAFSLADERIEESEPRLAREHDSYFFYRYQDGHPTVNTTSTETA